MTSFHWMQTGLSTATVEKSAVISGAFFMSWPETGLLRLTAAPDFDNRHGLMSRRYFSEGKGVWGPERIAFHDPMLSQKPWSETMIWQGGIGIPMRSFRSACKKLCTVSAELLKNELRRTVMPKPRQWEDMGKRSGEVPDSPFSRISENRKAEKVRTPSRLGYVVPGAGIEPARLAAGDFESPASTNFTTRACLAQTRIMAQYWT